jgi:two-component system, cell cycle sensor histidine kinase and response regulator CckA
MSTDTPTSTTNPTLREKAEERLSERRAKMKPRDPDVLIHELEVHQIELEMQNEELRRAKLEVEESREMYLDLYDFAPVGYLTLTEKGNIFRVNLTASKFLGTERAFLLNKPFSHFMPTESQNVFHLHRQKTLNSSEKQTCELVLKKNGGTFYAQLESIRAEVNGQPVMRSVLMDITERKQGEEQLRHAQKMEAIGALAGGIAHDFNNILGSILGFTEMAIEDIPERPEVQKSLHNVLKSTTRAKNLVEQILAFSRKASYVRGPISISPIITETVQLLRASIPATIRIELALGAISDTIFADPVEVKQILMNLVTNASLAMQAKGGTLEISLIDVDFTPDLPVLETEVIPGKYVQLVVKDTGIGMSPQVMKRVFEPFFTTREVGKGKGMGLAVVYGIVRDLQGTIAVESEPGVGSTFQALLPKVKTEVKDKRPQTFRVLQGTESILFIDDEHMLMEWGRTLLERLGYTVTTSTDPTEALNTFCSDPSRFDLVITDQTMPSMTGVQLAKELFKARPDIPIVLCTGHSETISADKAKEMGIRLFLMKPVARQELAEAVRRVLDEVRR